MIIEEHQTDFLCNKSSKLQAKLKAAVKTEAGKKFSIDCYYQLLSRFLVTFTTTIAIAEKVCFAMPGCWEYLISIQSRSLYFHMLAIQQAYFIITKFQPNGSTSLLTYKNNS